LEASSDASTMISIYDFPFLNGRCKYGGKRKELSVNVEKGSRLHIGN
jgi:hypothetical protein